MNSFEDRGIATDVTGGGEAKTTDQASAHVRQNITVKVRHDHDGISVKGGIRNDL